ncbi:MAG: hypothetical protein JWP38_366 [Herbaspirillum sp.]|nr:hypothetical protein [Herbaspirillum sp.]
MADFRTFPNAKRLPAQPLKPVVDPAGWQPDGLGDVENWSYHLSEADCAALIDAAGEVRRKGVAVEDVGRNNFDIKGGFAGVLGDVRQELRNGRGLVMLRNFPVRQMDSEGRAIAFLGIGAYLGKPMSQNMKGHILGHVKDLGGDYANPNTRGYFTRAEMRCHADPCDYVGLLCLQTAKSGGASRVASSVTVYNTMLERHPDLVAVLVRDFYRSRKGDVNPGQEAWYTQPIFSFADGYFSATGAGSAIDKAQGLPGVPPMTPLQAEAIRVYRAVCEECLADIPFKPGDVQFLNNYVALHTRRDYEDWPEAERKRHLLRLWLSDPDNRPIPTAQREGYRGRGVLPDGVKLNAPLDVIEAP